MPSTIADRIRILLHFKKLTATQFAEITDIQRSSVSHVLSGRNKPSLDFIQKIVTEFPEVSFEWLINGQGKLGKTSGDSHSSSTDTNVTPDALQNESDTIVKNQNINNESSSTDAFPPKVKPQQDTSSATQPHLSFPHTSSSSLSKPVKRIVVFYEDGTFESFLPE